MLIYFVTFISFMIFYTYTLPSKPLLSWASEMRLLSLYIWEDLLILFPYIKFLKSSPFHRKMTSNMTKKKKVNKPKTYTSENYETTTTTSTSPSILDLPDLALESILEKLEPADLCTMACVSTYLNDISLSDFLWKRHMKEKWGRIIGPDAQRAWESHIATQKESNNYFFGGGEGGGFVLRYLAKMWHVVVFESSFTCTIKSCDGSIVSFYRALETGKFWFPAQVFNRENGHVGFIMSCYDAELCYDSRTNTFEARYPPHGTRAMTAESGVTWERLRATPVDNSPHDLLISDSLKNLHPKDHIEIQWRRNKEFPYGWWYGVINHLESCDGNATYCQCHKSDTLVLEFKQYAPGSRWRHMTIDRNDHREEGNETGGFYGGIKKLYNKDDISMWQEFWPAGILE
ncbi:hypothetical protein LXL04_003517 [Taraxacum kok-saghyz]